MVDFCGVGGISLFTSIVSKLLHSKLIFSAGNYTLNCNVRPKCVLYYTEKKPSFFLNVTAEKMLAKCTLLVKL